jgi:hypothetical protein
LSCHQKTDKQLNNYHDCRLGLSIILSELGLKLVAQVAVPNTSRRDLAILLWTQSRAQGNVDKILARWRPDLSVPVEEAEDTVRCLAQRIVNEQREYAQSLVGSQVLLGAPVATAVVAAEEEAEATVKAEAPQ